MPDPAKLTELEQRIRAVRENIRVLTETGRGLFRVQQTRTQRGPHLRAGCTALQSSSKSKKH